MMQANKFFLVLIFTVTSAIIQNSWQQIALVLIIAAFLTFKEYQEQKLQVENDTLSKRVTNLEEFASTQGLRKLMGR